MTYFMSHYYAKPVFSHHDLLHQPVFVDELSHALIRFICCCRNRRQLVLHPFPILSTTQPICQAMSIITRPVRSFSLCLFMVPCCWWEAQRNQKSNACDQTCLYMFLRTYQHIQQQFISLFREEEQARKECLRSEIYASRDISVLSPCVPRQRLSYLNITRSKHSKCVRKCPAFWMLSLQDSFTFCTTPTTPVCGKIPAYKRIYTHTLRIS